MLAFDTALKNILHSIPLFRNVLKTSKEPSQAVQRYTQDNKGKCGLDGHLEQLILPEYEGLFSKP